MLSIGSPPESAADSAPPNDSANAYPQDEELGIHNKPSLFAGYDGLAVMSFGVCLPALLITIGSVVCFERILRLVFKHPVETLAECLLVTLIPVANYLAWRALRHSDHRRPLRLGVLNGLTAGTSIAFAAIITASIFFGYAPHYMMLAIISGLAGATAIYLGFKLRDAAATRQSKSNRVIFSVVGVVLSILGLSVCEAKSTAIRVAETMAVSDTPGERIAGLDMLRALNCEQDLRMQCADARTAGIPGLFLRISPQRERELYFAVTGKPYGNSLTESVYSMSDEYLRRHVVGTRVKGLNLLRSQIAGTVNAETLTSTVNWTFVLKNSTFEQQEARAEIALPPGAVLSDLTLWAKGQQHKAMVGPTDRVSSEQTQYGWVDVGATDPALVTDLGRGRVLLKCAPVPSQSEMKVQLSITERLKPFALDQASLTLPKFVDTNFSVNGDHSLRLHAGQELSTDLKKVHKQVAADGGHLLLGSLSEDELLSNMIVTASRPATLGPFFAIDSTLNGHGYIKETLRQVPTSSPEHLVVVIDNSESMRNHLKHIIEALRQIPANVKTSVIVPSEGTQMEPVELGKGIDMLAKTPFVGGKDNLQAVIKAAEAAGETKHGAVLWIHGPQPSFNEEMYIMAPYIERPSFYELALDDRWTDTTEFFKNHQEIGPFTAVSRSSSLGADLKSFLSKWKTGGTEFVVQLDRTNTVPPTRVLDARQSKEVALLLARDEAYELMRGGKLARAAELATASGIVTPVTGAVVLGRSLQRVAPANDVTETAWLQGAVNGTIGADQYAEHANKAKSNSDYNVRAVDTGSVGPQGDDATIIAGINTAGTVRVNNLANLEASLNLLANASEILGIVFGVVLLVPGLLGMKLEFPVQMKPSTRVLVGGALIALGLAIPGFVNWTVASARDANLFS